MGYGGIRADGREARAFLRESGVLIDQVLGFLSNIMVIGTLTMAAAVPLSVSGASELASDSPSLGNAAWHEGWQSPGVRTGLHWAEAVLMAMSAYFAFHGVLTGFILYSSLSLYLPDLEAKVLFLRGKVGWLSAAWGDAARRIFCRALRFQIANCAHRNAHSCSCGA